MEFALPMELQHRAKVLRGSFLHACFSEKPHSSCCGELLFLISEDGFVFVFLFVFSVVKCRKWII